MKRWRFVLFILILVFISYHFDRHEVISPHAQMEKKSTMPKAHQASVIVQKNNIVQLPPSPPQLNRQPAAVKIQVDFGEEPVRIGKSFALVENIRTIPKAKYLPSMGQNLTVANGMVYFRPASSRPEGWPVAQDKSSERLFPVSHILHVKGVDADLRTQLQGEGMREFYYHSRLKLISLEATPATVVKQYHQLTARGYEARLEVIKDPPQSK